MAGVNAHAGQPALWPRGCLPRTFQAMLRGTDRCRSSFGLDHCGQFDRATDFPPLKKWEVAIVPPNGGCRPQRVFLLATATLPAPAWPSPSRQWTAA